MNNYKVMFTVGKTESYDIVTELTETAARKFFTNRHKGQGMEISGVELVRENTTATRQQERDALETIRKIVAGLGPQSYLATAFAGCFEDAENNIEDDAAYSMKDRWESSEEKVKELESKLRAAQVGIEELVQKDDERMAAIERMKACIPFEDDIEDAVRLMGEKVYALKEQEAAAKVIVEKADQPDSPEFRQAVLDNRNARKTAEYYTNVMKRLANLPKQPT